MEQTNRNFLLVIVAAAGLAASVAVGNAGTGSAPGQDAAPVTPTETFVYFPSQFTVAAPAMPAEHIQAF